MTGATDRHSGPVRIVIVGLRFGKALATGQLFGDSWRDFIDICGVSDLKLDLAARTAAELGVAHYESLEQVLADPSVEAVGLFTPPAGRAQLVRQIVDAGKHVLTTKPFELDAPAALAVLQHAREKKIVVQMNSPGPLPSGMTKQVLDWQRSHNLGQVISLGWETHVRYQEAADGGWYDDPECCPVAPIFRLGIYGINQILRIAGPVQSVSVTQSRIFTGRPTPDNAAMNMRFASGAVGSLQASFCVDDGLRYGGRLSVRYERGSVVSRALPVTTGDASDSNLSLLAMTPAGVPRSERVHIGTEGMPGRYQLEEFHEAVRTGAGVVPGEISPVEVARGVAVIQAMQAASTSDRWEAVEALA